MGISSEQTALVKLSSLQIVAVAVKVSSPLKPVMMLGCLAWRLSSGRWCGIASRAFPARAVSGGLLAHARPWLLAPHALGGSVALLGFLHLEVNELNTQFDSNAMK